MRFLTDWVRALFGQPPVEPDPARDAVAAREEHNIERLARVSGKTPEEVRAEMRRRALSVEVQSMRRTR